MPTGDPMSRARPEVVELETALPVPAAEAYAWHERPGALERLLPPWEDAEVLGRTGGLADGSQVTLGVAAGPVRLRWVARHRDTVPGAQFTDEQLDGPFAAWTHLHRFEDAGPQASRVRDRVEFIPPFGPAGRAASPVLRRKVARMLRYRHATLRDDLAAHHGIAPLRIAVTGASGLIGSALVPFLETGGHTVVRMVRSRPGPGEVYWDPSRGTLDPAGLEGIDAVIHLAGENLAGGRWTAERKRALRDSRTKGTRLLAESLARLARPPRVLISASAIGIYGDRGDTLLDESAESGTGFLADLGRDWEAAAAPARDAGIRVAHPRMGVVLSPRGGALARLLLPFRTGLGGPIGNGRQWWSCVSIDDAIGALHHAAVAPALSGPFNVTAPEPLTNRDFARTLGRVLRRPAIVPVPAFALRAALGEMADAALLASARVVPGVLGATGYRFRHPTVEAALRHVLGR